ncbi:hypothetical protein A8135_07030 [Legionella jamestowniensis]|uniref:Protein kinase domain-containing protein n=1 Tax=Legionella jamestowniensis TaxID=455 RepID=A0ABX2XXQ5_9GAMM|nr:protein kinase [Legionella jamestowniensis]OCH99429.1 hypothetical protein A8135_07030 [Legionella jamestowniensis]
MPKPSEFKIKSAKKPYIPHKIGLSHLDENGFLNPLERTTKVREIAEKGKSLRGQSEYKRVKDLLDEKKFLISNLQDELNLKDVHLNEIDRILRSIENLEEDLNSLLEDNDEERKNELLEAIPRQEQYIINLETKLATKNFDEDYDETEKSVQKELEKTRKKLKANQNDLREIEEKPPEFLQKKEEEINRLNNELLKSKQQLVSIVHPNTENSERADLLQQYTVEEWGELAREKLSKHFAALEPQIQAERQTINQLEKLLAITNPKLRKAYLQSQGIETFYDTLIAEYKKELKVLTVYLGEQHQKDLGAGAFGKVKIAQDEEGTFWAVKYMAKDRTPHLQKKEYKTLKQLDEAGGKATFQSLKNVKKYGSGANVMVMKLAPGVPLSKPPKESRSDLATIEKLEAISDAILCLHNKDIIHFDLKPENILYDAANKKATIIDYGTATALPEGKQGFRPRSKETKESPDTIGLGGSPLYAPLEMRKDLYAAKYHYESDYVKPADFEYTKAFDVYTAGILMADNLGLTTVQYLRNDTNQPYLVLVDENSPEFINNKAIKDPTLRKEVLDMLKKMTVDEPPSARPDMEAVKKFFSDKKKAFVVKNSLTKTAVINIDDYKKMSPADQETLRKSLANYDEVLLISPQENLEVSLKDSLYIRREFEEHNILVREDILHGSKSVGTIVEAIPQWDAQKSEVQLNSYSYLSIANHKLQEKPINRDALVQDVIKHLKQYRNQMGVTLDHKKLLNAAITKLETEKMSIDKVGETLDDLQRKTGSKIATNFKSTFFLPTKTDSSQAGQGSRANFKPKP